MRFRFFSSIAVVALAVATCFVQASAQTIQGEGKVELKQANGTTVPVSGATVTFYRTDIAGKGTSVKTGKDGRYVLLGLAITGKYTITASAPGASPSYLVGVPINQHPTNDFTLTPGDGNALTLEQINQSSASGAATGGDPAAAKKAAEDYAKKRAETEAKNKNIGEINATVSRTFKAGNDAYNAKQYDAAVAAYNEGLQADPEQSVLYLNKSVALRARAVEKYNASIRAKDQAAKTAALDDFKAASEASENAVKYYHENLKTRAGGGVGGAAAQQPNEELNYLNTRAEAYSIALRTGSPVTPDDAVKAMQEYYNAETDPTKKAKAENGIGDAMFFAGRFDDSANAYRQVLAKNPNNYDAMFGLGYALAASATPENPARATEARDVLKQFLAKSPATHPKRADATEVLAGIEASLAPKPAVEDTTKKRRKG